jgi:hypothetical protein
MDFNEFCDDIKDKYPQVKNIIRMKNKFQNDIKMIKLEFTSSAVRDELLNEKRIIVNYITYDITEYLAPATYCSYLFQVFSYWPFQKTMFTN